MTFLHHKFLVIFSSLCLVSSALYAILIHTFIAEEDILLSKEPSFNGLPCSLSLFNFEKISNWHEMPDPLNFDVFTSAAQSKPNLVSNTSQSPPIADLPCPIRFNGWSGINDSMILIFSALNSNQTFIGTVGDSFENPSFTIVSCELRTNKEGSTLHSVPIVTILDKKLDRLITLAPASRNES